jgi:hypothetical protein
MLIYIILINFLIIYYLAIDIYISYISFTYIGKFGNKYLKTYNIIIITNSLSKNQF